MEAEGMQSEKTAEKQSKPWLFRPGQSGNPNGRPKGTISLTAEIKKRLEMLSPDQKRTALEVLADNIIQDALDGRKQERKLTWNYVDGMPQQKVEVTGDLTVQVVKFDEHGTGTER